ncbi:MAG: LacI family DNA-binding transcriptional regulator [Chloroflexota bacterium]
MATIKEVAERAGVAPITVSRVVNNSGYVSKATRERVEAAAAELEYVPNMLARSLRFNRTDTLALILTDITNPFWTTVARGAEDASSNHGFNLILCNTDEQDTKQEQYVTVLLRKRVDGFLYVPTNRSPDLLKTIQAQKIPVVVLDRVIEGVAVDAVRAASEQGAYEAVKHLLELGHRDIAALTGPIQVTSATERISGYRRALREWQLTEHDERIIYGEFTVESGYAMAHQLLAANIDQRPTAFFAANNFIAIGALKALEENRLHVPKDLSIASFDDLPAWSVAPFLTASIQPAYELGYQATELLIKRIQHPATDGYQEIVLPTELVIRDSCQRR